MGRGTKTSYKRRKRKQSSAGTAQKRLTRTRPRPPSLLIARIPVLEGWVKSIRNQRKEDSDQSCCDLLTVANSDSSTELQPNRHDANTITDDRLRLVSESCAQREKQENSEDLNNKPGKGTSPPIDSDQLEPLVPSTRTQKTYRRLARQKQLEQMKTLEQSDNRRMRFLKRQRRFEEDKEDVDSSASPKKQVKWKDKVDYHSYTPEPSLVCYSV